ncbi:MAG: zinc ABC transporter solute-binding protein [Deltaproteobacteria bacterium]|nr:zinc ABC transporter solute-binding protein [Deltaproteobacteria bacterium]
MACRLRYYFSLLWTGIFLSLSLSYSAWGAEKLQVSVSIIPQKYFVRKIGADLVDVNVMVLPGASPATYEPKPKQMALLTESKIYFAIGVPFEKVWLERFAAVHPRMVIVHSEEGIEKMPMKADHRHEEADQHKGDGHAHGIRDPHIWLSPPLVKIVARNILHALLKTDPLHRVFFEANYRAFCAEIDGLDEELKEIFSGRGPGIDFMVYHPAWGYFARAYGLNQIPIEMEGKEPKPRALKNIIGQARDKGVKVIFVQPQFSGKSARTIARAMGGRVIVADPLAPDWAENLRKVAEAFRSALK